jgi:hypothetical protein
MLARIGHLGHASSSNGVRFAQRARKNVQKAPRKRSLMKWVVIITLVTVALALLGDVRISRAGSLMRSEPLTFAPPNGARVLCEVIREVKAQTSVAFYPTLEASLTDPQGVTTYESVRAVKGRGADLVERASERADALFARQQPVILRQIQQFMTYHQDVFSAPLYRDLSEGHDVATVQAALQEERKARERLHAALDRLAWDLVLEGAVQRTMVKARKDVCLAVLGEEENR